MSRSTLALAALLLVLGAGAAGYWRGTSDGRAAAVADQNAKAVTDLTEIITSGNALVKAAGLASQRLRQAVAARAAIDDKSTKEVSNALATTSDSRAGCAFPPGVMRELSASRDRAAQAAASGIRGAVPSTGGSAPAER